jgi:hypothetical protein
VVTNILEEHRSITFVFEVEMSQDGNLIYKDSKQDGEKRNVMGRRK